MTKLYYIVYKRYRVLNDDYFEYVTGREEDSTDFYDAAKMDKQAAIDTVERLQREGYDCCWAIGQEVTL